MNIVFVVAAAASAAAVVIVHVVVVSSSSSSSSSRSSIIPIFGSGWRSGRSGDGRCLLAFHFSLYSL